MTVNAAVDRRMMGLALRAARRGRPSPNPHVGAVVAKGREVLAIGHHERAGEAHAEVAALRQVGDRARGATLYVTFEPCNHHGRTGPCTEAVLEAGLARVVVGCRDPAPHVPGAIERLRAAGVEVEVGVREAEATELIADFEKHFTTGLPWVTLKAAVTLDGRMATRTGDSKWITGERARREAHRLRDRSDAVMVGVGTVLADDPELTVRMVPGRNPLRIVLDTQLRIPSTAKVLSAPSERPTLVFHGPDAPNERRDALAAVGAEPISVPVNPAGLDLDAVLRELGRRSVVRLLVEGGPTLSASLFERGLADAAAVFVAPCLIGDIEAPSFVGGKGALVMADAARLSAVRVRRFGPDVLMMGRIDRKKRVG